ncbi:peptidylprolyl isomerase [Gammaproteobacteria bacterium]|nr:peptidylprolyl isomerase [Gammaproteobacteria bacterium]MDC0545697.1 peptidylprolyl isomerase [Gammaproteobacteria bacterium]MDC0569941.1 peptidylprolyl isomerase [Gammaproteobacteria bacterium]
MDKNRFYSFVLFAGILLGALMAAYSVIEKSNISDYKWAAKIEDTFIPMEKYLTQLDGLSKDKRSPLTQKDKEYVLERMIEEELLIKRAIDLGVLNDNPMARGTIVQQMIKTIIAENARYEISDSELESFFQENSGFFTKSSRLRIQQIYFSNEQLKDDSLVVAKKAYDLLKSGDDFESVSKLGSPSALQIPNSLMTLSKVREYIGPSLMNLAKELEINSFTTPIEVSGGYKIIYLIDKELASPPQFNDIKASVSSEFLKRKDDQSLRSYLENLKNWYDVSRNLPK